jgi:sulfatase modifying factor 1
LRPAIGLGGILDQRAFLNEWRPPLWAEESDETARGAGRDMVWIPGGAFIMGSDRHYPEERPARRVRTEGFWIDRTPVTNRDFARFVGATNYRTVAETGPSRRDYPDAPVVELGPGSMVFTPTAGPVPLDQPHLWWRFVRGALADAEAYAEWAGVDLPSEAQWERAARGGLGHRDYAWGDALEPEGAPLAKTWHGDFPYRNAPPDGWPRTAPVKSYPPNGYGLHDMIGNVWEWTADWWSERPIEPEFDFCCSARRAASADPGDTLAVPRRVLKGGSHLCAPSYCRRYRPAARHAHRIDTSASHLGFRCALRPVP